MGYSSSLKKDFPSILLLMFLYFLQWIPLGLIGSLPYILSARKVSYADQGTFSFAMWPFSLKLLWAPIVDSLFIRKLGRRKSWFVYETHSMTKQKANQYFDKLF
jgi:PAT family acetyl-CoA transporter-like MFS transporter 1